MAFSKKHITRVKQICMFFGPFLLWLKWSNSNSGCRTYLNIYVFLHLRMRMRMLSSYHNYNIFHLKKFVLFQWKPYDTLPCTLIYSTCSNSLLFKSFPNVNITKSLFNWSKQNETDEKSMYNQKLAMSGCDAFFF